jgi:ferrochelatase
MAERLGIPDLDWAVCYQSRVGRLKWIGPSTDEELERAAKDKCAVIIYPHAFTQEHVETLVEIEIEYREKAHELHVPGFYRVPTVATHPAFIDGLAKLVREHDNTNRLAAEGGKAICPAEFPRCCMRSV